MLTTRLLHKLRQPDMLASLARGASIAFIVQVSGTGIRYLSQILFARWMGPVEYGAYAYAFTWAQLLAVLSGLGLTTGVLRFIPQYLANQDWGRLRGVVCRSRQLTFTTGIVLAVLGSMVILLLQSQKIKITTLLIGMWLVPFLAPLNLQAEMLRGTQRIALASAPPMLLQPILATGAAFLILRATSVLTSVSTMSAVTLAILVILTVQVWGLSWALPKKAAHVSPVYETTEWLRVSFPLLLIAGFQIILNRADILMIGLFMGQKEAGIYNAAARTATLAVFVLAAVNAIAAPMIASLYAKGDHASLQRMVSVAVKWVCWPSLAITLGLVLFGKPILWLFGPEFTTSHWALKLLAIGQLVNANAGPVGYLMSLTGHQDLCARVYGLSALVNIALNAALIPRWGLAGAALATMVSMILWNVWLYKLVKKHLGIRSFVFATLR